MDEAIETWEDEGGSRQPAMIALKGTVNQIAWAEQIRTAVNAEFDRVRKAIETAANKHTGEHKTDIHGIVTILEDKRCDVMANESAGYFIHDWQEIRDQVRTMILADVRYAQALG
jgi:hypothetical protein